MGNGRPEYVRECCDASLLRLGVGHIDIYYQHRVDGCHTVFFPASSKSRH